MCYKSCSADCYSVTHLLFVSISLFFSELCPTEINANSCIVSLEVHEAYVVSVPEMEPFIDFLQQLSDMGAAMKGIITKAMLDSHVYEQLQSTVNMYRNHNLPFINFVENRFRTGIRVKRAAPILSEVR